MEPVLADKELPLTDKAPAVDNIVDNSGPGHAASLEPALLPISEAGNKATIIEEIQPSSDEDQSFVVADRQTLLAQEGLSVPEQPLLLPEVFRDDGRLRRPVASHTSTQPRPPRQQHSREEEIQVMKFLCSITCSFSFSTAASSS